MVSSCPTRERSIAGIKRVSKPGLRVYARKDNLPRVLGGLGVAIISTSGGLMTDRQAKNKGVVHCLEEWATSKTPSEGYEILVAKGLSELTGEHLVLKYAEQFSSKAVAAAKARVEPVEG